jgi:hypothetical protein
MARKFNKAKKAVGSWLSRQRAKLEIQIKGREDNRVNRLKQKIKGLTDPEEIMLEILEIFTDVEIVPEPGNYYTFIYKAKTPGLRYDQHPLIAAMEVYPWGFRGLNFHWGTMRNYTWNEVLGQLHVVYKDEINYMRSISYAKFLINR